ncbi:hypothetical protein IPdc08_01248 [archaeon]|nr:hypothetical protein IPdc08_01248 [archaeon]
MTLCTIGSYDPITDKICAIYVRGDKKCVIFIVFDKMDLTTQEFADTPPCETQPLAKPVKTILNNAFQFIHSFYQ